MRDLLSNACAICSNVGDATTTATAALTPAVSVETKSLSCIIIYKSSWILAKLSTVLEELMIIFILIVSTQD